MVPRLCSAPAAGLVLLLGSIACTNSSQPAPSATATRAIATAQPGAATAAPSPGATVSVDTFVPYPAGTQTGDAAVDDVVRAFLGRDLAAMRSLARLRDVPCTTAVDSSAPTCPTGSPAGSTVSVLLGQGCHPVFWQLGELANALPFQVERITLLAVAAPKDASLAGGHFLLFGIQSGGVVRGWGVTTSRDGLVEIDAGCGVAPDVLLQKDGRAPFLLELRRLQ